MDSPKQSPKLEMVTMSQPTHIDPLHWNRRLGYRLRREQYQMSELEAPLAPLALPEVHAPHHAHPHKHEAEKLIETLRDQLLRSQADFDNYRKRTKRDEHQRIDLAAQRLIEQLLPVLDNFNRALANPGDSVESLHTGIEMVHKQFEEILTQQGLTLVEAVGQPFNPKMHEAIGVVDGSGQPDNTVVEVFQPGYLLKGRLIRPAMVRVARAG
jgi:molecular chaperone GrpE